MNGPSAITENKIKIIESYSDNAKAGDIVTVVSAGGTITYEEYSSVNGEIEKEFVDPKTLNGEELDLSFEGGESLEIGKEYIIFASMQKIDAQGTKKYCIEGINQGLFKINGNKVSSSAEGSAMTLPTPWRRISTPKMTTQITITITVRMRLSSASLT